MPRGAQAVSKLNEHPFGTSGPANVFFFFFLVAAVNENAQNPNGQDPSVVPGSQFRTLLISNTRIEVSPPITSKYGSCYVQWSASSIHHNQLLYEKKTRQQQKKKNRAQS